MDASTPPPIQTRTKKKAKISTSVPPRFKKKAKLTTSEAPSDEDNMPQNDKRSSSKDKKRKKRKKSTNPMMMGKTTAADTVDEGIVSNVVEDEDNSSKKEEGERIDNTKCGNRKIQPGSKLYTCEKCDYDLCYNCGREGDIKEPKGVAAANRKKYSHQQQRQKKDEVVETAAVGIQTEDQNDDDNIDDDDDCTKRTRTKIPKVISKEEGSWFYRMVRNSGYSNIKVRQRPYMHSRPVKPAFFAAQSTGERVFVSERLKGDDGQTYLKIELPNDNDGHGWIFTQDPMDLSKRILRTIDEDEEDDIDENTTAGAAATEKAINSAASGETREEMSCDEDKIENHQSQQNQNVKTRNIKTELAEEEEMKSDEEGGKLQGVVTMKKAKYVKQESITNTDEEKRQVYLLNLSFQINDKILTDFFKDCGDIESIKWEEDNGRFAGRGWVRFKTEDAAKSAVLKAGTSILGRPVIVRRATDVFCNRIYVRNLSDEVSEEAIRKFFADCGAITEIKWIEDRVLRSEKFLENTEEHWGIQRIRFRAIYISCGGKGSNQEAWPDFHGEKNNEKYNITSIHTKESDTFSCEYSRPLKESGAASTKQIGKTGEQSRFSSKNEQLPKTRVFISNLDYNIDETAVREFFSDCGDVRNIKWSEKNGEFFCKGVVEFESADAAQKAVKKSGELLLGKELKAEISNPPRKRMTDNTIFLGNLPFDVSEQEVRDYAEDGSSSIKGVRLVRDRTTQRFKGYAFIEFDDQIMAKK
eukprot:jgi/Bigna1/67515/fgenesh1_pg.4_\